jgi:flap endonuclease-1
MRSREKEIISDTGRNVSHIHGLINSLTYYLKNGIIPIFIFDGKPPDIKRKKIEERKRNLRENLSKLRELDAQKKSISKIINAAEDTIDNDIEIDEGIGYEELIYGTPPVEVINLEEEIAKMNNIQEEYKKIYKKSIILKDYYIKDWIEILQLLGLPVIKAEGEADPLCAYILKNNPEIYGIISDDSDMLVFGASILMRKSVNQHFTIIELNELLDKISDLLSKEYEKKIDFVLDNLIDFSILLGTDYGSVKLNKSLYDTYDILKYYIENDKDYTQIIYEEHHEEFLKIKKYYTELNFGEEYNKYLQKPIWEKPKLMELKERLLQLHVDEDFIDKNNDFLNKCYNRIKSGKIFQKNDNYKMKNLDFFPDCSQKVYNTDELYEIKNNLGKYKKNLEAFDIDNDIDSDSENEQLNEKKTMDDMTFFNFEN